MGLEVLSNIGATYKEVPREIIKLDTSNTSNLQYDRGVQTIAQTETKAVQNTENNKANAEGDEKSKMNQRIAYVLFQMKILPVIKENMKKQ